MKISIARLVRYAAIPLAWVAVVNFTQPLGAQTTDDRDVVRLNRRLKSLIRSIDDIKWSNITIYRLEDEFSQRLIRSMEAEDTIDVVYVENIGQTIYDDPLPDFFNTIKTLAGQSRTNPVRNYDNFKRALATHYGIDDPTDLDDTQLKNAAGRVVTVISKRANRPKQFYLVTSRDHAQPRLIALLGVSIDEMTGKINLSDNFAFVGTEVYNYLHSNGPDTTMYAELKTAVSDGTGQNLTNQMFVLRDLSEIQFVPTTKVRANYLDENRYGYVLTSISEGRPLRGEAKTEDTTEGAEDFMSSGGGSLFGDPNASGGTGRFGKAEIPGTGEYPYEISVGTDVIASFRAYDLRDKKIPDPSWGVELRNNFDEINYPSIWGGRMTLNVLLENIKIGAVLPEIRFGGNSVDSSGIGSRPQRILGGYGLAMSGDFTAPLLNNSGLFNFYASYTFSEQKSDKIRPFLYPENSVTGLRETVPGDLSYLVRYAFQAFYSFGFYADAAAQHMFRIKVGGTVYGIDQVIREQDTLATATTGETDQVPTVFTKLANQSQSIGGVAARIEYMKGGQKIPYGLGLQYFDQSLLANLWIQFVVGSQLDLKLEGKYFTPIFRDPHPWEQANLVVPSASLIYHFGL
jgi:hypothetical protein